MRLWLDPAAWLRAAFPPPMSRLRSAPNNYQSAPGQAKGFYTVTNISAQTGLTDVSQFKRMVVKAADGAVRATRRHRTGRSRRTELESSVAMNGQQAVFIGIQATPTGNPLSLVKGVRALLPEISATCRQRWRCRSPTTRPASSRRRSTRSKRRSARRC